MIEIIIILLLILIIFESIIISRKIKQNDKYQEVLELYENWIENFALTVESIDEEIDRLDTEGTFRADDEVGFFFQAIYSILKRLSEFGLVDEPVQIPGTEKLDESTSKDGLFYKREIERQKRVKKRRNENIKIEDIQKKNKAK